MMAIVDLGGVVFLLGICMSVVGALGAWNNRASPLQGAAVGLLVMLLGGYIAVTGMVMQVALGGGFA